MSQLETLLWFCLGFAVASLLALFLGRAAWRSGIRVGARRMQRKVPGTVSELQTERDSMRAENAMMARKLEVRMGELKARLAEQTAEVSRHRNRIEILAADLAQREKLDAVSRAEIARLQDQVRNFESELTQRTETAQMALDKLQAKETDLSQGADEIAALKAKIWKLQTKTQPIEERLAEAGEQSERLAAELRALDKAWPDKLSELGLAPEAPVEADPAQTVSAETALAETVNGGEGPVAEPPARPAGKKSKRQQQSRLPGNVVSLAQRIKALQKTITR